MSHLTKLITCAVLLGSTAVHSEPTKQIYASIDAGIFQAHFNSNYLDQTDVIPQNISNPLLQDGYTGGLAIGYTQPINSRYFLGLELSGQLDSKSALFQSGAASTAFSDEINLRHHIDLTVVPGIITQSAFNPYIKLGISYAAIKDNLISPVGFNPVFTQYTTNKKRLGFVAALGIKHAVNERLALFSEANYHDFGTFNLSSFQNFSAQYSHSSRLCSYGLVVGALYAFNL